MTARELSQKRLAIHKALQHKGFGFTEWHGFNETQINGSIANAAEDIAYAKWRGFSDNENKLVKATLNNGFRFYESGLGTIDTHGTDNPKFALLKPKRKPAKVNIWGKYDPVTETVIEQRYVTDKELENAPFHPGPVKNRIIPWKNMHPLPLDSGNPAQNVATLKKEIEDRENVQGEQKCRLA